MPYINFVGDLLRLPSKILSAIILAGMILVVQEAYAQLTITKSVAKISVLSGELFTYTLQYRCANITSLKTVIVCVQKNLKNGFGMKFVEILEAN